MRHAKLVAELMLEKKALNVKIIDVRKITTLTDFFIICTSESQPQTRAITDHVQLSMKQKDINVWHIEGYEHMKWILIDYINVVIHIFDKESRESEIERISSIQIRNLESYLGGLEYQYIIDRASRTIKYSRDGGTAGLLLQNVVVDTTINEERYTSRFAFKGVKGNELVTSPALSDSIHGVELTFYLLRGESFYSYTTYAAIDENHLNRSSVNSAQE